MSHFLTIEDGQLYDYATTGRATDDQRTLVTPEMLPAILADDAVMCSSSIDYPDEYTTDPTVLAMCATIRA